jgi:hypothetical protein
LPISQHIVVGQLLGMFVTYPRNLQTVGDLATGSAVRNANIVEMLGKKGVKLATDVTQVDRIFRETRHGPYDPIVVLLDPIRDEDALPILTLNFDLSNTSARVLGLRTMIFKMVGEEFFLQGFRFESPTLGQSAHGHYHAQLITDLSPSSSRFSEMAARWVPTTQPAFCLDARNPVQLVMALLVSLYGLREVQSRLGGNRAARDSSKSFLKGMHVFP